MSQPWTELIRDNALRCLWQTYVCQQKPLYAPLVFFIILQSSLSVFIFSISWKRHLFYCDWIRIITFLIAGDKFLYIKKNWWNLESVQRIKMQFNRTVAQGQKSSLFSWFLMNFCWCETVVIKYLNSFFYLYKNQYFLHKCIENKGYISIITDITLRCRHKHFSIKKNNTNHRTNKVTWWDVDSSSTHSAV